MSKKRDMYVNKEDTYKRIRRHRKNNGRKNRGGVAVVIGVIFAFVLGISSFLISRNRLTGQEEFRKTQIQLGNKEADEKKADVKKGTSGEVNKSDAALENEYNLSGNTKENIITSNDRAGDGKTQEDITKAEANFLDTIDTADTSENSEEEAEETFLPGSKARSEPRKVKGIYVTGPRAGKESYMKELIDLVDTTELNTMVIDIKNDNGEITYKMDLPEVKDIQADVNYIGDIKKLIDKLKEKDIYLIARIVAFKDPILAKNRPDLCLKQKDGSVFRDKNGLCWVNPYKKEVWDYLLSIAKEAAAIGFDEIQFDYIRFSTDKGINDVDFGKEAKSKSKMDIISEFTKYVCDNLKPLGVYVSADVFGTIIDSKVDAEIVGQDYKEMSKYLDYICPMIYPSHYQDGSYGILHPDLKPYDLIKKALEKSQTTLKGIDKEDKAIVRSWLQDFTATWLTNHKSYGPEEIRDQIQAVYDAGYEEWILWNGNNNYTKDGLIKE
ncbi:putative glycoside hydrolase [Anaerocolumna sp. MB42-C2]|uniref:putative glycoside hydrolase n=1 Tax=Anaerocolumna sp. MB42-C2 TaxID=3070997 RepID=UPI0027E20AEC|nr:putative glycoside hydrolase [Anaerocolumna sp. MB42-C2]WMJ86346.1 putative glycoside hydrolase [Anaerocolumna sp. MB42-C2]